MNTQDTKLGSEPGSEPGTHWADLGAHAPRTPLERARATCEQAPRTLLGPILPATCGRKDDGGKALAAILYEDFPHAMQAVIEVASFGARKYARSNWLQVPDALQRYKDALHRHLLASQLEPADSESGLPHAAHAAWNVLAVLELELRQGGAA